MPGSSASGSEPRARAALACALGALLLRGAIASGAAQVEPRPASPGQIRGRVEIPRETSAPPPRPSVAALGQPTVPDPPDRRTSVLYLETAPQGAFEETEPARPRMDQRNQTFVPWVLAVSVGTSVEFPNSDSTYHNVFSLSRTKRFDLGRYPRGQSRSVRFDHPGVVRVFCEIHSHMNGFILVFAHRYFATTDDVGRYRIGDVPAGDYRLVLWHDGRERGVRSVHVEEGGVAEADFVVK